MSNEQIAQIADAVAARLNGQLSGLRKDMAGLGDRLGKVETRLVKVETHLDRMDGDLKGVKEQVGHLYTALDEKGLI